MKYLDKYYFFEAETDLGAVVFVWVKDDAVGEWMAL